MADALVKLLNNNGYQPIFLPRTHVAPPELYSYSKGLRRLVRWGALATNVPDAAKLPHRRGRLAQIEYQETSSKHGEGSLSFLKNALRAIGIEDTPKLDLSFTGGRELSFCFGGVTYDAVDPAELSRVIQHIDTDAFPKEVVEGGNLHIAYEYAFATSLKLQRADRHDFEADISADIGQYVDLGTKAKVAAESKGVVSFTGTAADVAAFAFKAGRLELQDKTWRFYPEEIQKGPMRGPTQAPPAIQPGVVFLFDQEGKEGTLPPH